MRHRSQLRMSVTDDPEEPRLDELGEEDGPGSGRDPWLDGEIPRRETAYRIALTALFALVASVIRTALALIVVFELAFSLITRRAPGARVRELANRITSYYYRLLRYMTYNESRAPFPFSDFPEPLEPDGFRVEDRDSEVLQDQG